MNNNNTKASPRTGFTNGPQQDGNPNECFYCQQKGHRKTDCVYFIKHQQELNGFKKTKPTVGANVVSFAVCVMTRAQRVAADEGKKDSESGENGGDDDDDDTNSGSSEEQEDHQNKKGEEESNDEEDDMFEQDKYIDEDDEIKERSLGANIDE